MNILIMGKPGAGKGTQSTMLLDYYKFTHISTGDIYRREMANETELGILAKSFIDHGNLVPDDITNKIVKELLEKTEFPNGFMLDGYPRTVGQAVALDEMLQSLNLKLDAVINVDVRDEVLLERMAGRRVCHDCNQTYHLTFHPTKVEGVCDKCGGKLYQRKDDEESSVLNRLNIYNSKTKPLLEYYENKKLLITINGEESSDVVFEKIIKSLGGR